MQFKISISDKNIYFNDDGVLLSSYKKCVLMQVIQLLNYTDSMVNTEYFITYIFLAYFSMMLKSYVMRLMLISYGYTDRPNY